MDNEKLVQVAMNVIMHAGESEQYMISILYQCLKNMKKGEK